MCPPAIGDIHRLMDKVRSFQHGLMYRTVRDTERKSINGRNTVTVWHCAVKYRGEGRTMPNVTIRRGSQVHTAEVPAGTPLALALAQAGCAVAQPCGGRGVCGKCAAMLQGSFTPPSAAEQRLGARLVCQAVVLGEGEVVLPQEQPMEQIEMGGDAPLLQLRPMPGRWGAAVDIGTTTLVLRLYDLQSGRSCGVSAMLNPQTTVAADIITRMDAALHGRLQALQSQVQGAIAAMLAHACAQAGVSPQTVESLCVTGNTTMLYLLQGMSPEKLSRAPFQADCLFGSQASVLGRKAYLPPCMHAFVGADITCAILASDMCRRHETALLCDMGTNGEMALWKEGVLYIASTAAGPAFEGAGVCCGCGSVRGAIDRVELAGGRLWCHTIGGEKAAGLCGSGLIDAVSALLDMGVVDETGAMDDEVYPLAEGVALTQADIRAVQLAKAAVFAGMGCLMHAAHCTPQEIATLYLAGGFGSHLNVHSAARIGLIPAELAGRVHVLGNAALNGAACALLNLDQRRHMQRIAALAQHVELGGSADFASRYVEAMMFPAAEEM